MKRPIKYTLTRKEAAAVVALIQCWQLDALLNPGSRMVIATVDWPSILKVNAKLSRSVLMHTDGLSDRLKALLKNKPVLRNSLLMQPGLGEYPTDLSKFGYTTKPNGAP